jgi:regulator of protease activity HflC (stomatin/prohibitin superfamily)
MLVIKYLLMVGAVAMLVVAAAIILYDVYLLIEYRRRLALNPDVPLPVPHPLRWEEALRLAALSLLPLLLGLSIAVVPSGMAGVRVSEFSGTRPGVLYAGSHLIIPLVDSVALYDVRDKVYTTLTGEPTWKDRGEAGPPDILKVQSKEGLPIGLAISVRYHLDAAWLIYIHNTLPSAVDSEVVRPVIGSTFRAITPNYTVREVFAAKREEIRKRAADEITHKLGGDGILVKEVMLREVQLPPEYAKGLEGLLLKEQENDQMGVQAEIKQKEVRVAEYEAEADKVREEKKAEADAKVRVLQAKAEADAMQYTLPLKEKQIQQTRLESEARKEATIKNAEASAQAKVIDSKAELERRNLLADAEANRIRVTAKADFERMQNEAAVLKQSPLLINKIIAERLSDKVQIMMVPADGKYFFASDVLRGQMPQIMQQQDDPEDPPHRVQSR